DQAEPRRLARSPVLNQFRLNPFRVLRVPVDVGTHEAVRWADELLTPPQEGAVPPEPDPLPWLPAASQEEVRQAGRSLEDPARRLLEQVCWFDFKTDPEGEALRQGLAALDTDALKRYLAGVEGAES